MKTIQDSVKEDVAKLTSSSATMDGIKFLHLDPRDGNYFAANKYIAALEIIRGLNQGDSDTYIPVSRLTRDQWVKYRWVEVTTMSDKETMLIRGTERLPDEAAKALSDWRYIHDEV